MSVPRFYPLRIKEVRRETADCVSVSLDVPEALQELFHYAPGQYLTFRTQLEGPEIRRSYSICSSPNDHELRVAIKKVHEGRFSTYANETLRAGDQIEVMPPMGKFTPKNMGTGQKHYVAFAAGSGITPVMSIMKTVLETEPDSDFTLVYGNRNRNTIIFREAIEALKNKHMQRLRVYHVLSREMMDVPLFNGRIDAGKCLEFCKTLIDIHRADELFLCGPEEMILSLRQQLLDLDVPSSRIHMELFASPDQPGSGHRKWAERHEQDAGTVSKVSIRLDGVQFEMDLAYNGDSILDAALKQGADLPYACKGGVCCTCRAKITEGEVDMEVNYALEQDEIDKGFVLTCQSHPKTPRVIVDFDAR